MENTHKPEGPEPEINSSEPQVQDKLKLQRLEVTTVGSDGHYRIRVQVTENSIGVKSTVWIGAPNVFGVIINNKSITGLALISDGLKTMSRQLDQAMKTMDMEKAKKFREPSSRFNTTNAGFLECLAVFNAPVLEVAFSIIGSDADIEEQILLGPAQVVLPKTCSFHETIQAVLTFNRQKKIRR